MNVYITSASPAGHGAPKATEPLRRTGDSMGMPVDASRNTSQAWPYALPLPGILLLQGCVSGSWWYATIKLGPGAFTMKSFPGTTTGCHHVASFSEDFYALAPRFFDQKNYGTRTHIVSGHYFRLLRPILYFD